ncbi:MAG: hypothetical protein E5V74_01420 [Mesorhizobium sp.]|nr:MAG: hypothetical protein E5W03_00580 [Mesorhizobium sp.]TIV16791.1 MAG: hypothetical protein E5W02_13875 [Mesorhizobium sp.]TIV68460.1 MAG: hypothetical protein E5V86_00735 [Mesorhizobium sp.]TIW05803.1 MAG: hypothetical protein E5V74_01420 [Mesorhizobium sp.]
MSDTSLHASETHVEEDENYFISMTDMMVGVLFIFIILLMAFALNFRQQTQESEDYIKRLKKVEETAQQVSSELDTLQRQVDDEVGALSKADEVRANLLHAIKTALEREDKKIRVTVDEASGALRFDQNAIQFDLNDDQLSDVARARVNLLARVLTEVLPPYTHMNSAAEATLETLFVEGHADQSGDANTNWNLSTRRAVSTFRQLTLSQHSLSELTNLKGQKVLSVAGYGDTRPIPGATNDQQRRIELRFVLSTDLRKRLNTVRDLTNQMEMELESLRDRLKDVNVR